MSNQNAGTAAALTLTAEGPETTNQVRLAANGGLRRLDIGGLSMLLYPASEFEAGLGNIHLRVRDGEAVTAHPLLGPATRATAVREGDALVVRGRIGGLVFAAQPRLAAGADAWFWQVDVRNEGAAAVAFDLVHCADVALTPYQTVRVNEYYLSQYLDLTAIDTAAGTALAVRNNMPNEHVAWVMTGCLEGGVGYATDALQLLGEKGLDLGFELPNARLQHEHTLAAVASRPVDLAPGQSATTTFYGWVETDHAAPTSEADAAVLDQVRALPEAAPVDLGGGELEPSATSLFDAAGVASGELTEAQLGELFGTERTLVEEVDGTLFGFVAGDEHVTTAAKQDAVLRPHGHILRTGSSLVPETAVLSSTIWMDGGFASQVTQGHVSLNRLLSTRRTYLGLQQAHGLRIFVDSGEGWQLLGRPSAWGLRPDRARWVYALDGGLVEVVASAPTEAHRLDFTFRGEGTSRVLLAWHSALGADDGIETARPELDVTEQQVVVGEAGRSFTLDFSTAVTVGRDEVLWNDGVDRGQPWVCVQTEAAEFTFSMSADTVPADVQVASGIAQDDLWRSLSDSLSVDLAQGELSEQVAEMRAILPFFEHNAFVHYLSPRGLEQYTGGGWGTRDVCQGPVGLLTAIDRPDALRQVVKTVLADQNARGDWPQAFDFLPPLRQAGQWDSHGDVVYWPLLMVGEHLQRTADASLLDEQVPMVDDQARTEPLPISEHLKRAVDHIASIAVPGKPLPAYGHGDWNDSLQPADPALAKKMVSSWTSVLQAHTLNQLAKGLDAAGACPELAQRCHEMSEATAQSLRDELVVDEVMAGYGVLDEQGGFDLVVHPRDERTGLTYGVLPWIHAISSDVLDRSSAEHHLELLREHLFGPDGARLFDKPATYRGGPMEVFQRAEGATFWGREIGLMYTHAHLRYSEALARFGDAEKLFEALMLANPMGLTDRVSQARPRQTSCYYSSSDAVFADRYEAADRYADMMAGKVELEGGWRIYSSGPGLWLRLVVECLLGVRVRGDKVELDPVLDPRLDGLTAKVPVNGTALKITYRVTGEGCGVTSVRAGDREVAMTTLENPYRAGGALVALAELGDDITIEVG